MLGHRVLGSLIAASKVDCVFTTNFDPLVEESAVKANALLPPADQTRPTVAAIDSGERTMRCLRESDWPLVAKLHGDYQSTAIKNTGSELEQQDERMRHVLVEASKRFGIVFVGYSGRDASIMETLTSVLRQPAPFPNGLYWVTPSANRLLPAVTEFLEHAHQAGVDVAVVECKTFDELAGDVIKHVDLPQALMDHVMQGRATPRLVPVNLPSSEARQFPVLRYSALFIESLPSVARRMSLAQTSSSPVRLPRLKRSRAGSCSLRLRHSQCYLMTWHNSSVSPMKMDGAGWRSVYGVFSLCPEAPASRIATAIICGAVVGQSRTTCCSKSGCTNNEYAR